MFRWLLDSLAGKPSAARSPQWPKVRANHLIVQPCCQACGVATGLEVHHKVPVHVDASLELDTMNLITLCERNGCHFLFGHGRDWRAFNGKVDLDCANVREMIAKRRYK